MTKNIYVMFDKVSKTWTLPFFEVNNEKVIRDFQYLINEKNDSKSDIGIFYQDKELFILGTYNETNGNINLLKAPEKVLELKNLKTKTN